MSDTLHDPDPDLEARVRRAMRSLADSHQPAPNEPSVRPAADDTSRRTWLIAAAALLVVGGVVAVLAVAGRDTSPAPVATNPPPVSSPSESAGAPNADGDIAIDPASLRFAEPLPDGTVAFVNDTSLRSPSIEDRGIVGSDPGPTPDAIRVVVMDGPRLLMRGIITDVPADTEFERPVGPAVDIGVTGATYIDADEGAIVIPLDGARRVVGPDENFTFGGGGPYIEPDALIAIATAVGQVPIDEVDQLPGFFVYAGSVGGVSIDPIGVYDATKVQHGMAGLTLYRLAEPPTALELLAIGNALFRGEGDDAVIGDVALTAGAGSYLELVSPVDLVVLSTTADLDERIAAIDFSPATDLEDNFDGRIGAPPRP